MRTRAILIFLAFCVGTAGIACSGGSEGPVLRLTHLQVEVPFNSTYHVPDGMVDQAVALFSEHEDLLSIHNDSGMDLVFKSISVSPGEGVTDEEFTLWEASTPAGLLDAGGLTLPAGDQFDFYVRFRPVASGPRMATLTIKLEDGSSHSIGLSGTGQGNAQPAWGMPVGLHKLWGGVASDENATGMVSDSAGNAYFAGNVSGVVDEFAHDLFLGGIDPDGNLKWAKIWNGPTRDYSPYPDQNEESGGGANALSLDSQGYLYLAGAVSDSAANANYSALVMKVDPGDGAIVWENLWRPAWADVMGAGHSASAYSVDVAGSRVYVVGTTGGLIASGDALVFLLCLDRKEGTLLWQRVIDVVEGKNDRAYAVHADLDGNLYVGGLSDGKALVMRLSDADDVPYLEWARRMDLGFGGHINSLALDEEGGVYLSCDRRAEGFSVVKLDAAGAFAWGLTYGEGSARVVSYKNGRLLAGGAVYQPEFDAQMGDGLVLELDPATGDVLWDVFYYTGKGTDEAAEHLVKGLALSEVGLFVSGQVYTTAGNPSRYWGYWYEGVLAAEDFKPNITPIDLSDSDLFDVTDGALVGATGSRNYVDAPSTVSFQNASSKLNGDPPDEDLFVMRLDL